MLSVVVRARVAQGTPVAAARSDAPKQDGASLDGRAELDRFRTVRGMCGSASQSRTKMATRHTPLAPLRTRKRASPDGGRGRPRRLGTPAEEPSRSVSTRGFCRVIAGTRSDGRRKNGHGQKKQGSRVSSERHAHSRPGSNANRVSYALRRAAAASAPIAVSWRATVIGSGMGVGVLTPPRCGASTSIAPALNRLGGGSPAVAAV